MIEEEFGGAWRSKLIITENSCAHPSMAQGVGADGHGAQCWPSRQEYFLLFEFCSSGRVLSIRNSKSDFIKKKKSVVYTKME